MQAVTLETLPVPLFKHLHDIHLHLPGHARDTFAVVPTPPNTPATKVPWTVIVVGLFVPVKASKAVAAIHGIHPYVRRKILVRCADAGIQHGHDNVARRGQHVPGIGRMNVGTAVPPLWP